MKEINQFIYDEIANIKACYLNGVYSKEFALGQLSSLNNLAGFCKLGNLAEDIHDIVVQLCSKVDPLRTDRRSSCASEASTFHLDPGLSAKVMPLYRNPTRRNDLN
ncbi:hypothetical protein M2277_005656 [Paenibacillus sp. LBL]|nr:hypothetical protein [Paenibacillus sp. LBL]